MSLPISGVLTIVDTTRIQSYIYRSNRLSENVGASHLVYLATDEWVNDYAHQHDGNVMSRAGGNAVILFPDLERARDFTRDLSQRVLEDAPGLQIHIGHTEVKLNKMFLGDTIRAGLQAMITGNRTPQRDAGLLGLGVTAMCQSTALPAVGWAKAGTDRYPASAEILAKTAPTIRQDAERKLRDVTALPDDYAYPRDFDDLGRTPGEESTIAVIHADGNGVGQLVQSLAGQFEQKITNGMSVYEANAAYLETLQSFSSALTTATEHAIQDTVQLVVDWLNMPEHDLPEKQQRLVRQLRSNTREEGRKRLILPLRPLIIGGDDVTLVCDGRLGVSLAKVYLERFTRHAAETDFSALVGSPTTVTACAGVAILKTRYPFARAYELADDLCGSAKKQYREDGGTGSYLDWHFAASGMVTPDLDGIRKREYKDGALTLRPVALDGQTLRSWSVVKSGLDTFNKKDWARSKRKALQESLLRGGDAVTRWRAIYGGGVSWPPHTQLANADQTGYVGEHCVYYDALELSDTFIDLETADAITS